jgi:hypothetical protein
VEPAEVSRAKQAEEQSAKSERGDIARVHQGKLSDPTDEEIPDDDVEKAPEHVDR